MPGRRLKVSDRHCRARGRIVERVAQRRAEQARPEAEHVAEDDVIRQVADAFDKVVDDHLATLNRTAIFPEIFSDATGQDRSPAIHFATAKDCLKVIITVRVGKPHGLPSVEPGDRGPVVAYLNCMELGERLPEVLETLGRAHGMMERREAETLAKQPGVSSFSTPMELETIRRQGTWLVAILGVARQADVASTSPLATAAKPVPHHD